VDTEHLSRAAELLGYQFSDHELLREALTHSSSAVDRVRSNERLEFLGDAVLGMVVCETLFRDYPDLLEGDMTKIKSVAVSRRTCAEITKELGLDELLKLGSGMPSNADMPSSLSAAVLESVIGALYIDGGLEAARAFIDPLFETIITQAAISGHQQNFKSVLQQHAQDTHDATPTYSLLDEKGPDHAKAFEVSVQIGATQYQSSWGASKKQAEQQAALNALLELGVAIVNDEGEIVIDPRMKNGHNAEQETVD
jgi:ribonuclease-3